MKAGATHQEKAISLLSRAEGSGQMITMVITGPESEALGMQLLLPRM